MKTTIILTAIIMMGLSGCKDDASCMKPGETGRITQLSVDGGIGRFGDRARIETIRFAMGRDDEIRMCETSETEATKLLKVGDRLHVRDMTNVTP